MLAFNMSLGRASLEQEDPAALSHAEAKLEALEARLAAQRAELERREDASFRALEEERQELVMLTASRASEAARDALSRVPALLTPMRGPAPEHRKATKARLAALEARQVALEAEQRAISRGEEGLDRAEEAIAATKRAVAEIRARALQLVEAEKAAAQAAKARRPAPTADERRRHVRVALETEVGLASDSNFYSGFSSDLSEGGIFVGTCNVLERGTEVDLTFTLPTGQSVSARGVVRWTREFNERTPDVFPGVGVEFTTMAAAHREAIHAFTSAREPMFYAE